MTIRALRETERWVAWVRLGAVAFALLQLLLIGDDYPDATYERLAWATTAAFTAGALILFWLSRRDLRVPALRRVGFLALVFDSAIVSSYVLIYSFESGTPIRQALFIPVIEAALRYGIRGGIALALVFGLVHTGFEKLMSDRFDHPFQVDNVTFAVGVLMIAGVIVGWLVERLRGQSQLAIRRANEAEALRDELGRRADLLDAANTCARALSSSLDVEQAFGARPPSGVPPGTEFVPGLHHLPRPGAHRTWLPLVAAAAPLVANCFLRRSAYVSARVPSVSDFLPRAALCRRRHRRAGHAAATRGGAADEGRRHHLPGPAPRHPSGPLRPPAPGLPVWAQTRSQPLHGLMPRAPERRFPGFRGLEPAGAVLDQEALHESRSEVVRISDQRAARLLCERAQHVLRVGPECGLGRL